MIFKAFTSNMQHKIEILFLWTCWIQFGTSVVEGLLDRKDVTAFETFRKLNVIYLPVISKITCS